MPKGRKGWTYFPDSYYNMYMMKENTMHTIYVSPVFKSVDGSQKMFRIHVDAWKYYVRRDQALLALIELGGIHAPDTEIVRKLRRKMLSAKRAIERKGYFSTMINS